MTRNEKQELKEIRRILIVRYHDEIKNCAYDDAQKTNQEIQRINDMLKLKINWVELGIKIAEVLVGAAGVGATVYGIRQKEKNLKTTLSFESGDSIVSLGGKSAAQDALK